MTKPIMPSRTSPEVCTTYPTREESEVLLGLISALQDLGAKAVKIGACAVTFGEPKTGVWEREEPEATEPERSVWAPMTLAEIEGA